MQRKTILKAGCILIFALFAVPIAIGSVVRQIDSGYRGVKLRNGKIVGIAEEGLNFKLPIVEKIVKFEIRTQKEQIVASAASKDLQDVKATVALNYHVSPIKVTDLYKDLGTDYRERIIIPRMQETTKSVTARYSAEEIVTKRSEVKQEILSELKGKIDDKYFVFEDVNIVNIEFSPEYTRAVEQKQLAEQAAKKAENDLRRIEIEAQQQITRAKGEAEAQAVQQQTLNALLIQKQFIEKWDGQLPIVFGGSGNLLDISELLKLNK